MVVWCGHGPLHRGQTPNLTNRSALHAAEKPVSDPERQLLQGRNKKIKEIPVLHCIRREGNVLLIGRLAKSSPLPYKVYLPSRRTLDVASFSPMGPSSRT